MNGNITYNRRKLKRGGLIFACFTRDGIVHIKKSFSGKSFKTHHTNILHKMFPDFNFNEANRGEGGPPKYNQLNLVCYWENFSQSFY